MGAIFRWKQGQKSRAFFGNNMTTQLSAHPNPLQDLRPPIERLMKHVLVDVGPGAHWFWNANRRNHRHNARGHALFTWKVAPTARSGFKTRGEYTVARVLLEQQFGAFPARTKIENQCRLPQCVNPAHWVVTYAPPRWRLEFHAEGTWQIIHYKTNKPADKDVPVHVFDGQLVHVVSVEPLSRRIKDPSMRALCGSLIDVSIARLVEGRVTCTGGC